MGAEYTETVFHGNTILAIPLKFGSGQNIPMGHLDRLAELRKQKGWTQTDLAERMGVEQPTIGRWERGNREPDIGQILALAQHLGVEPGLLLDPHMAVAVGPRLFVKGDVAAGMWRAAVELPEDEWQTFTGRSDVTVELSHRFGLRVLGDSMDVVYPHGTIVECVSVFGGAEIMPGKRVIVVRENEDNEFEATVKELVEQDDELWLVPRSTNPAHRPFRLNELEPGILEQRIAAVVVSSVRPE